MISILSRKAMTVALLLLSAVAYATPFKNIHLELTVNETGRGRVYMQTEDPSNEQSRKSEDVVMKCTLGENGNDTLRFNESYMYPGAPATCIADSLTGLYMVWLNAEPEDGYELAGYSLIKKDNPDAYTKADLIKTTFTDNTNFEDPHADNDPYFVFNANIPRQEDAKGDGSNNDTAREEARAKNNWSEAPDWKIYAIFVPEGTVLPDNDTSGISTIVSKKSKRDGGQAYSLDGRAVTKSYKGIVVKDGKKFLQK